VTNSYELQLDGLRRRFCDRAMAQSHELEEIVSKLEDGAAVREWGAEVRRIAHSLAGAGGTFGFSELSAHAGELDEFVRRPPESIELAGACRALICEIKRAGIWRSCADGDS
jgi:HPt (histidine-containing phosphotransfer) domain-containing protein